MTSQSSAMQLQEIALRIRELREILGYSMQKMAELTEVSEDILARCAIADPNPGYYNIPYYTSDIYTPQPGDLFFTKHYSHVGLVYYVEGEYFYTLEGNTNDVEEEDSGFVMSHKRELKDYYFGVPAYEGCDKDHTYVRGQDQGHPHKIYYKCSYKH